MNVNGCPYKECDHKCGILIIKDPCEERKAFDEKWSEYLAEKHDRQERYRNGFLTAGMTVKNSKKRGQK